jgi:hypothetical protein
MSVASVYRSPRPPWPRHRLDYAKRRQTPQGGAPLVRPAPLASPAVRVGERRQVLAAIGPFWDNEVWLLATGGALFVVIPRVLASGLSGFYVAIFLVLRVLILRGISIEFRSPRRPPAVARGAAGDRRRQLLPQRLQRERPGDEPADRTGLVGYRRTASPRLLRRALPPSPRQGGRGAGPGRILKRPDEPARLIFGARPPSTSTSLHVAGRRSRSARPDGRGRAPAQGGPSGPPLLA